MYFDGMKYFIMSIIPIILQEILKIHLKVTFKQLNITKCS